MPSVRVVTAALAAFAVACSLTPPASAQGSRAPAAIAHLTDGRALRQWDPSQSWPGGSQYDPRLDQPVQFWRAGLALSEAFDSVAEQTGVELAFWPEGDENARVRVNLYLNRGNPPSLRALMAQLAWVTDCALGFAGPEEDRTYYLLSTSVSRGALADRQADEAAGQQKAEEQRGLEEERNEQALREKLAEVKEALTLPREEVIQRYKGGQDILLLTLLDPERRVLAEMALRVIEEHRYHFPFSLQWNQLSKNEQAAVEAALLSDESWDRDAPLELHLYADLRGESAELVLGASQDVRVSDDLWSSRGIGRVMLLSTMHDASMEANEVLALGRLLGDGDLQELEQQAAYVVEFDRDQRERREKRRMESLAEQGLSPAGRELLSALSLSLDPGGEYAPWEIQEAVAAASSLHVVSDCFWQPRRDLSTADSALEAIEMCCLPLRESRDSATGEPEWLGGLEWGDAGPLLRFRSKDRARWRAGLLPDEALQQVDAMLEPHLPDLPDPPQPHRRFAFRVPANLSDLARIVSLLNDVQAEYGGRLVYGDPADPVEDCKQAAREAFLGVAAQRLDVVRFLFALGESELELARSTGLSCRSLSDSQLARLHTALRRRGSLWERSHVEGLLLRLCESPEDLARTISLHRPDELQLRLCFLDQEWMARYRGRVQGHHCLRHEWVIEAYEWAFATQPRSSGPPTSDGNP